MAAFVLALLLVGGQSSVHAQQGEAAGGAKGENFSAKPPAALFASDCTGGGCHKSPQGLAKTQGFGLAAFLREHYTNSRESAAALAAYLTKLPSGPEPREVRTRAGRAAPEPAPSETKPAANEPHGPRGRTAHTAATPAEPPAPVTRRHAIEPSNEPQPKPAPSTRATRGRQPPAAATAAAPATAVPPVEPTAPASPAPSAAAPAPAADAGAASKPPPKQFDIFD